MLTVDTTIVVTSSKLSRYHAVESPL